jgi:hypothetical protein
MWLRGDFVARFEGERYEPGIVADDMSDQDEFLVVRWTNRRGVERINRSKLGEIRKCDDLDGEIVRNGGRSSIESLQALESIERLETLLAERSRTIKSPREQRIVDDLIRRYYAETYECDWDRNNADMLILLALKPETIGWVFKLREFLHRPIHAFFHRQ